MAGSEWRMASGKEANGEWFRTRYSLSPIRYSLLASTGSSRNCPYDPPSPAGRCGRPCGGPDRKSLEQSPRL